MKWSDEAGNQYRLTWRPWLVDTMHFNGRHWASDERAEGVLVEMKTWLGEIWFVRPERLLLTKHQVQQRDKDMSALMLSKVALIDCDCGCESKKPKDEWSAAWQQAASVVRCHPIIPEVNE